jgi:hypothetical protein
MARVRLTLIQLRSFEARWRSERLFDEDLQALESEIVDDPEVGDVMRGTGGLRKMRFAPPSRGRGKSGSFRVCYAHFPEYARVYLVILFSKNAQANLSNAQRAAVKIVLHRISVALKRGENP